MLHETSRVPRRKQRVRQFQIKPSRLGGYIDQPPRTKRIRLSRKRIHVVVIAQLTEPEAISIAVAQHQRNVSDCKDSMSSCDRSKLTASEAREVGVSEHQRNLADCKDGLGGCDRSKLTKAEIISTDEAKRQLNVSDCKGGLASVIIPSLSFRNGGSERCRTSNKCANCANGWSDCDLSKLTRSEASQTAVADHRRNLSACRVGLEACDYSKLTTSEAKLLADVERNRNYTACRTGHGYCDPFPSQALRRRRFRWGLSRSFSRHLKSNYRSQRIRVGWRDAIPDFHKDD